MLRSLNPQVKRIVYDVLVQAAILGTPLSIVDIVSLAQSNLGELHDKVSETDIAAVAYDMLNFGEATLGLDWEISLTPQAFTRLMYNESTSYSETR